MSKSISLSFGSYVFFVLILAVFCQLSCASITKDNRDRNSDWRYQVYDPESGLCGYIDSKGEMAIQPKFEECQELFNGLGYVVIDGKYGYIDKHGKIVIPAQFEYASWFSDGIAEVTLEGKEGFINEKGEFLFIKDESAFYFGFEEGLALVKYHNDTWCFIDKTGKQFIGPYANADIDCYDDFSEGLVCVKTKKKYGYMNKNGEMVIEPQFDFARSFSQGVAIVGNRDKDMGEKTFYVINKKGEIIAGPKNGWDAISGFSEGLAEVEIADRYGYVNTDLEVVISPIYDATRGYFKGGIVEVIDEGNGRSGYIDKNNTWVWSREQGRHLVFMFRETTRDKIAQSIEAFGAIPLEWKTVFLYPDPVKTSDMASPTWVYPDRDMTPIFRTSFEANLR